ncbi:MAG: hypothetical protein M4D80_04065 [Myxococcota bacterium]|nr:hypothetical protein [Myxococcota bacterium]
MVRSFATIVFIGVAAAAGIYVGTKKTVIAGEVMAANMLEQVKEKGVSKITCDEKIPVGIEGAVFKCDFNGNDGSTARFEYTMNRAGALSANLLESTGPK